MPTPLSKIKLYCPPFCQGKTEGVRQLTHCEAKIELNLYSVSAHKGGGQHRTISIHLALRAKLKLQDEPIDY